MSENKSLAVTFRISQAERNIIDFILNKEPYSQTYLLLKAVYDYAYDYLDLPNNLNVKPSQLYAMMIEKHKKEMKMHLGEERYKEVLKELQGGEYNE